MGATTALTSGLLLLRLCDCSSGLAGGFIKISNIKFEWDLQPIIAQQNLLIDLKNTPTSSTSTRSHLDRVGSQKVGSGRHIVTN